MEGQKDGLEFIVQAFSTDQEESPIGQWFLPWPSPSSVLLSCTSEQDTVIHHQASNMGLIAFKWIPPFDWQRDTYFRALVSDSIVHKTSSYQSEVFSPHRRRVRQTTGCSDSNPCKNGGTCHLGTCVCADSTCGTSCEFSDDCACTVKPCQNGGTCIDNTNGCNCTSEWTGNQCEVPVDNTIKVYPSTVQTHVFSPTMPVKPTTSLDTLTAKMTSTKQITTTATVPVTTDKKTELETSSPVKTTTNKLPTTEQLNNIITTTTDQLVTTVTTEHSTTNPTTESHPTTIYFSTDSTTKLSTTTKYITTDHSTTKLSTHKFTTKYITTDRSTSKLTTDDLTTSKLTTKSITTTTEPATTINEPASTASKPVTTSTELFTTKKTTASRVKETTKVQTTDHSLSTTTNGTTKAADASVGFFTNTAIIGIAVGGAIFVFLLLIAVVVFRVCCKRRRSGRKSSQKLQNTFWINSAQNQREGGSQGNLKFLDSEGNSPTKLEGYIPMGKVVTSDPNLNVFGDQNQSEKDDRLSRQIYGGEDPVKGPDHDHHKSSKLDEEEDSKPEVDQEYKAQQQQQHLRAEEVPFLQVGSTSTFRSSKKKDPKKESPAPKKAGLLEIMTGEVTGDTSESENSSSQ